MTVALVAGMAVLMGAAAPAVHAHYSFVHKDSQIACNYRAREGQNWLAQPIVEDQPFEEWWFHGQANCQHKSVKPFELPAGGSVEIAMGSRTSMVPAPFGNGKAWKPANPDYVMNATEWGSGSGSPGNTLGGHHNIHSYTRDDTSGCALAIAYKKNASDVQPDDFVVFTVVHDCPKRQRETVDVPRLPKCPGGVCICAWFWLPKNSGLKNFYMTPFECTVTGDVGNSPVDFQRAIPPRRCLDPRNCNFGPRRPMYWLGDGHQINMPEDLQQSPHYSIRYGFREGAQHDIFKNTNPRRAGGALRLVPTSETCKENNGATPSRLTADASNFLLKSPDCGCTAEMKNGRLRIRDVKGGKKQIVWKANVARFGPNAVREDPQYKANAHYMPTSRGPFRLDLNNNCYLSLTDIRGLVLWESPFNGANKRRIVDSFRGYDPDPAHFNVEVSASSLVNTSSSDIKVVADAIGFGSTATVDKSSSDIKVVADAIGFESTATMVSATVIYSVVPFALLFGL